MNEQLHRYYVSKDYSEFLAPKHNSVLPKHFLFSSVGPLHPGEKLYQGYIQRAFSQLAITRNMESRQNLVFGEPSVLPPPFFPQSSVFLRCLMGRLEVLSVHFVHP